MTKKPSLTLAKLSGTSPDEKANIVAQLFKKLTGKDASPAEMDAVRKTLKK